MDVKEFDKFAEEYLKLHSQNIRLTGEEPEFFAEYKICLLYTSPSPRDGLLSRMPSSA